LKAEQPVYQKFWFSRSNNVHNDQGKRRVTQVARFYFIKFFYVASVRANLYILFAILPDNNNFLMEENQIVWITGASEGIGLACAQALAQSGKRVVMSARNRPKLIKMAMEIRLNNGDAKAVQCDVRSEEDVEWAIKSIIKAFGEGPDILINNAGISPYNDIEEMTPGIFDDVIATNLTGNFLCAKAVLPEMIRKGKGTIIQMLSIASTKAFAGGTAYGASKFGALGFTNALREEVRHKGIRVVSVMPGATETPSWDDITEEDRNRMMQPEDIAQAIVDILNQPQRTMVEEIVLRPIGGDL
jgi:NAD(P)-dependent dehydrogenase (short-subunit alcohol dehydrogenase family)